MIPKKQVFLFVAAGIGIFMLLVFTSSWRQGWFAAQEQYTIEFESGEGVNAGTSVSMSGLKAGRVTSVDLAEGNHVVVKISIQRKFAQRLRHGSKAVLGRPFIIGEKAISLIPGASDEALIPPGSKIAGEESLEITDMLSGGRLSPYMNTLSKLLDQLRIVIEGDGQTGNLVDLYKQVHKSLKSVDMVAKELTTIRRDFVVTPEMQRMVSDLSKSTAEIGLLVKNMNTAMPSLTHLSGDVAKMMPEISQTLSETTFTLQALQKSFLLRGAVADLKEERAKYEKERKPASVPSTTVESVQPGASPAEN